MDNIYENYIETLYEVFNKPLQYEWIKRNASSGKAKFKINDSTIVVLINQFFNGEGDIYSGDVYNGDINNIHEFLFFDENNNGKMVFDKTGKGNQFAIFSTVIAIADEYIKKYKKDIHHFGFISEKKGKKSNSRTKLYSTMFKKLTPSGNWEKIVDDNDPSMTIFILKNKDYNND